MISRAKCFRIKSLHSINPREITIKVCDAAAAAKFTSSSVAFAYDLALVWPDEPQPRSRHSPITFHLNIIVVFALINRYIRATSYQLPAIISFKFYPRVQPVLKIFFFLSLSEFLFARIIGLSAVYANNSFSSFPYHDLGHTSISWIEKPVKAF